MEMSGSPQFTWVENMCKRYVVIKSYEPHVIAQYQIDIPMVSVHSGSHDLAISAVMVSLGKKIPMQVQLAKITPITIGLVENAPN